MSFNISLFTDQDLPKSSPWSCPKCSYHGKSLQILRIHYGVRHKVALEHLSYKLHIPANALKKETRKIKRANKSMLMQEMTICQFCSKESHSEFEHKKHIVLHFKHELSKQLPSHEPFQCPKCDLKTYQHTPLLFHYGIQHYESVEELLKKDLSHLNIDMLQTS